MPRQRLKTKKQVALPSARPIVIVGAGNMGGALARGLIAGNLGKDLVIIDPALTPADTRRYRVAGVTAAKSANAIAMLRPRAVIFAVKPQMMPGVVTDYAKATQAAVVISIAAGTTSERIAAWLGGDAIIRPMRAFPTDRCIDAAFRARPPAPPAPWPEANCPAALAAAGIPFERASVENTGRAGADSGPGLTGSGCLCIAGACACAGLWSFVLTIAPQRMSSSIQL